jgi:uncharacterized protein YggE
MEEKTFNLVNKAFLLSAVLVVGILAFFVGQIVLQNREINLQNQNQITVSGIGKIYVKPDVAVLILGVENRGAKISDIVKDNTEKMNKIISDVKNFGVEEKDIQTTQYTIAPEYNWTEARGRIFVGYVLTQQITLKIRDFEKIGSILDKATADGANSVGDLQFTIDDSEQIKQEARAKAIAQAKANAENLAKESGVKLGKIINVYENYYPIYSNKAVGIGGGVVESVPAPVIEPGQQEINVTINLTYQVK